MIKYIVILTKIIISILLALLFSSCNYNFTFGEGIDGTGDVTIENREIKDAFTKIDVDRGLEVIVTQASETKVAVEVDSNLQKYITTKVENGILYVSTKESIRSAESLIVRVQLPVIELLESNSGATIRSGSKLKGSKINLDSSSGSQIEAELEFDEIKTSSSSGSSIALTGKALNLITDTSSGSEINASGLEANSIESDASSGSNTIVNPLQEFKASASSGAIIEYVVIPNKIQKDESSGGIITQK